MTRLAQLVAEGGAQLQTWTAENHVSMVAHSVNMCHISEEFSAGFRGASRGGFQPGSHPEKCQTVRSLRHIF